MIRKQKKIALCLTLLYLCLTSSSIILQQSDPSMNFFEEFLKGLMEADEGELEEIFGKLEQPESITPQKPTTETKTGKQPAAPPKKLSKEEYFLKPTESKELVKKLTPEEKEAFYFYIDQFEDNVKKLEKSIVTLGLIYGEELDEINYKSIINELKAEIGNLKDKSSLRKGFFLPEQYNTRKEILNTIRELESIQKQIEASRKKAEEGVELEAIEELEIRVLKKPLVLPKKIDLRLLSQIKNLVSLRLKKIKEELSKIKSYQSVAKELKAKKSAKEKLEAQAAKARPAGHRPSYYAPPSRSGYPEGPTRSPGYPRYGEGFARGYGDYKDYGRGYDDKYKEQEDLKTDESSEPTQQPGGFLGEQRDEKKNYMQEIETLEQKNLELLNQLLLVYDKTPNKQNAYKKIFKEKFLSKIVSNLEQVKSLEEQLNAEQIKKIAESKKDKAFDRLVEKFIPIGVRLAKTPGGNKKEKEAALYLLETQPEKTETAVAAYEEEVITKLDKTPLEGFNIDIDKLDELQKKLQILAAEPKSDDIVKKINPESLLNATSTEERNTKLVLAKLFQAVTAPLSQTSGQTLTETADNYKNLESLKAKFKEEIEKEDTGLKDHEELCKKFVEILNEKLKNVTLVAETTQDQAVAQVLPILGKIEKDLEIKINKLDQIKKDLQKIEIEGSPEE